MGPGDDVVVIRRVDGSADTVRCGRGDDTVRYVRYVDDLDVLLGCETVEISD